MWLTSTGGGWSISWAVAWIVKIEENTPRTNRDRSFTIELLFATRNGGRALPLMIPMVIEVIRRGVVEVCSDSTTLKVGVVDPFPAEKLLPVILVEACTAVRQELKLERDAA
jgi:hypothetical protein